jgi:hypothetical protein
MQDVEARGFDRIVREKQRFAGERFPKRKTYDEQIGAVVHGASVQHLLWRGMSGPQAALARIDVGRARNSRLGEVDQARGTVGANHDVVRMGCLMHEPERCALGIARRVDRAEPPQDIDEYRHHETRLEGALRAQEELLQGLAIHVLEAGLAAIASVRVERSDVGVVNRGRKAPFIHEELREVFAPRELWPQTLYDRAARAAEAGRPRHEADCTELAARDVCLRSARALNF